MVPPIQISQIGTQYTNPLFFIDGTTSFARRKADFTLISKICINKRPKKKNEHKDQEIDTLSVFTIWDDFKVCYTLN